MTAKVIPLHATGSSSLSGFMEQDGSTWVKYAPGQEPASPSGGGPSKPGADNVDIATLKQRMNGAFAWLGILTVASGIAFLFLISRIDERFDKVDGPIRDLEKSASAQTETLKSIDNRMDDLQSNHK